MQRPGPHLPQPGAQALTESGARSGDMVRLASWSTSWQGPESSPRPQIRLNLWVSSSALRGSPLSDVVCSVWGAAN